MSDSDQVSGVLSKLVIENPWRKLRDFTDARIGLGRSGISIPTAHLLAFQLAHAQAQDAVHLPLDTDELVAELQQAGLEQQGQSLILHSRASDRAEYLQRPDYGRRLNADSVARLKDFMEQQASAGVETEPHDLAIVIVDGLSSLAIQQNTVPFLQQLTKALDADSQSWSLAPLTLVQQGRVAIGDEVGELLNARCVLLLVGERPGLSSPDSLGLYLTWNPGIGLTDAARNCISNVRQAGLVYPDAVAKLMYLLREARKLELSGVGLKDRSGADDALDAGSVSGRNFLTSE
ncbi:ethanolamine ammonia-lyase subunit EutC [Oceanobacter mangrovi]|uniref:ethanolamine ammonia-lyase subunit EutC n=1 Tax=Oceanobacter mangrovi TaxID=2862510 RepID=UPI001C8EDB77|nr:ethanolamine ammonia-lyase subunit EutC [Oceanobacter mangrovi]